MFTQDTEISDNKVFFSQGSTGMGIGLKKTDNIIIENNKIV